MVNKVSWIYIDEMILVLYISVCNDKPCNEEQRLQQRDELPGSQHHSNKRRRTFSSNMSQSDKGYFESYSHLVSPLPLRVVILLRLSLSTEL